MLWKVVGFSHSATAYSVGGIFRPHHEGDFVWGLLDRINRRRTNFIDNGMQSKMLPVLQTLALDILYLLSRRSMRVLVYTNAT